MAAYPFRDRPLSDVELERLRLVLSTFRDGTGQNVIKNTEATLPGGRDFERALAAAIDGATTENKGIFDVEVQTDTLPFGISCKMAKAQPAASAAAFMELSNAASAFRTRLLELQIHWSTEPTLAGPAIIDLVSTWHTATGQSIDLPSSRYAVLSRNSAWTTFQLSSFPIDLRIANPRGDIEWLAEGASLNGYIDDGGRRHRLWQCFINSGGQLKYYPLLRWADWITEPFQLETPPVHSLADKAAAYFPDEWPS